MKHHKQLELFDIPWDEGLPSMFGGRLSSNTVEVMRMVFGTHTIKVVRRGTIWEVSSISRSPRGTKFTARSHSFDAKDMPKDIRSAEIEKIVDELLRPTEALPQ